MLQAREVPEREWTQRGARAARGYRGQRGYGCLISELHEIIDDIGMPNVGICYDTGHGNLQGLVMAEAVRSREQMQPTALENGVALLHPRRPMAKILAVIHENDGGTCKAADDAPDGPAHTR